MKKAIYRNATNLNELLTQVQPKNVEEHLQLLQWYFLNRSELPPSVYKQILTKAKDYANE